MIDKLTRWQFSEFDNCLEISYDGSLVDYDEVKELFVQQEKELELYKTVYKNRELIQLWENLGADDKQVEYQRVVHSVDKLQELLANQEKKTKILLDSLENIVKEMEYCGYADDCPEDCRPYGYCIFCRSKRALEEYKKE
jgi:hypothetical protein